MFFSKNILKSHKRFIVSGFEKKPSSFNTRYALLLSLITGVIISVVMLIGAVRDKLDLEISQMVISLILNIVLSFLIFSYGFIIVKSRIAIHWRWIITIVGALAIAIVFSMVSVNLDIAIYGKSHLPYSTMIAIIRGCSAAIFALFITLLLFSITNQHRMQMENERLRTENLLIRYDSLEKQLNPHFMFNSLNTLSGLIGMDDEKAQNYLQQLAQTYRYTMQQRETATLAEELAFTDSYIYMMKIRYGENLTIRKEIPSEALNWSVVPISLQMLIENVLKHNVVSDRHPLCIRISVTEASRLRVSNPLQPKAGAEPSTGLGLDNLAKRYELRFQESISIEEGPDMFSVELPLIQSTSLADGKTVSNIKTSL